MQRVWLVLRFLLAIIAVAALIPLLAISLLLRMDIAVDKSKWVQARPSIEKAKRWVLYGSKGATNSVGNGHLQV